MKGYMYILECCDGTYYTGSTLDLDKRFNQHQNGEGANHTKKRLPVKLVYFEEFDRIDLAFNREKQVQGWSRIKKEALIEKNNPQLPELSIAYRDVVSRASTNEQTKASMTELTSDSMTEQSKNITTKNPKSTSDEVIIKNSTLKNTEDFPLVVEALETTNSTLPEAFEGKTSINDMTNSTLPEVLEGKTSLIETNKKTSKPIGGNSSLKGNTIYLRALEPEDLEFIYAIENNESIWHVSNTQTPYSKFLIRQYLENAHQDIYEAKQLRLAICKKDSFEAIGLIDLFEFDPKNNRAGIGIVINDAENRNSGIGSESLDLLIEYAFTKLNLHQIFANINPNNIASVNLFTKFGFQIIGNKKDWNLVGGSYQDESIYQLINK